MKQKTAMLLLILAMHCCCFLVGYLSNIADWRLMEHYLPPQFL